MNQKFINHVILSMGDQIRLWLQVSRALLRATCGAKLRMLSFIDRILLKRSRLLPLPEHVQERVSDDHLSKSVRLNNLIEQDLPGSKIQSQVLSPASHTHQNRGDIPVVRSAYR
jgi:hypothetical protein